MFPQRLPRQVPCVPARAQRGGGGRRGFAVSGAAAQRNNYEATLANLRIGRHTRVIFQGFTGRQATANARESLAWGTNIVGGVSPGRRGEPPPQQHLGLPVLPSVRQAVEQLGPVHATGVYVPAPLAPAAIEEAVAAEVPLIVAVAEHIPLHDMLRLHALLRTQTASRLVGANSPGIISAVGRCRIGFQPLACFAPGRVGIASKSGTLSYEAVASTTRAGLGQSLCIGVGGDIVAGTDLREALAVLADDPDTDAIALIGEIGGAGEIDAADWIREYRSRVANPKPIVALVAGINSPPGRVMGHAGAFTAPGDPSAQDKIDALRAAGATIVDHPEKFGEAIKARLQENGSVGSSTLSRGTASSFRAGTASPLAAAAAAQQRRGLHTAAARGRLRPSTTTSSSTSSFLPSSHLTPITPICPSQRRHLHIPQDHAFDLLRARGVNAAEYSGRGGPLRYLAVGVDRAARSPCVVAAPSAGQPSGQPEHYRDVRKFPFDYDPKTGGSAGSAESGLRVARIAEHLGLARQPGTAESLRRVLGALTGLFYEKEAVLLETLVVERLGEVKVVSARFAFDDAAYASAGRQADIHTAAATTAAVVDPLEAEAARHGIVYVRLGGGESDNNEDDNINHTIGTLVNGAGLAMNTVDALASLSSFPTSPSCPAANFLDTGGKATSETIEASFALLQRDPRVRVLLVNVFGGLTLGDMIARGVLAAFARAGVRVPVVVRVRGTNEEEARRIIAGSGLPLFAYDGFAEAAAKAVELARGQGAVGEGR